jgi:ribosomal protein S18 acetylase RimI-like enzyme
VGVPDELIRSWRALDALFGEPEPTRWGAIVTDPRFPAIWDANYARIDRPVEDLGRAELERAMTPALRRVRARALHVVSFFPEETASLLAELSTAGDVLSWDVVMRGDPPNRVRRAGVAVDELPPGAELWDVVRRSLALFGIDDPIAVRQLLTIEREVLGPGGKRWFGVREDGRVVAVAAFLVLEGVGYVDNVATEPAWRGRGLASAIVSHLVDVAAAAGIDDTFLLVEPDGPVDLYQRVGFAEVGRLASTRGPFPRRGRPRAGGRLAR